MEYTIVTGHPKQLRSEIIECVRKGEDSNGNDIHTWEVKSATFKGKDGIEFTEDVLVHTTQAWEEVGGLRLIVDESANSKLYAHFFYWGDYAKDQRDDSQPSYLYGRVTELLLVHFMEGIRSVMIKQ